MDVADSTAPEYGRVMWVSPPVSPGMDPRENLVSVRSFARVHLRVTLRVISHYLFHFPVPACCEDTWRAVNSTLTAVLSVGGTEHVCVCAAKQAASPLTCVLHSAAIYGTLSVTGSWLQHRWSRSLPRLIRSAPPSPVLRTSQLCRMIYQPSCATGPGPVAHPASRSMTSPSPLVTRR
jgi:hypothetical protein